MNTVIVGETAFLEAQQSIHKLIAQQAPLQETLSAIAEAASLGIPGVRVIAMRFDAATQTLSAMPNRLFSSSFMKCLQRLNVEKEVCTCSSAAHHHRLMITDNIQTDPHWNTLRDVAIAEKLHTCWSSPVMSSNDELLGTIDAYFGPRTPRNVGDKINFQLYQASSLMTFAVLKDRDNQRYRSLAESHQSLFLHHPDGVYDFDLHGHFKHCNAALERITGYPEKTLIGQHFKKFVAPDYYALTQEAFNAAKEGEHRYYETQGIHADGHIYFLEVTNFPMILDGDVVGIYGICRDITPRKHQEAEMRLLQRSLEASPNGISITDAAQHDTPTVYVNDAFCRITGYRRDDILGKNLRILQRADTHPETVALLRKAVATQTAVQVTLLNYRRDGTRFWSKMSINPMFDTYGQCTHFIGTQQDVTREQLQATRIAYQASHDLLTGLPNRSSLNSILETSLKKSLENQCLLAIVCLNLDGFKAINDGLGYLVGNQLLVAVAGRLRRLCDPKHTLAYLSGDEFAIVMPNVANREYVDSVAEQILRAFEDSFTVAGHALYVSASIGAACSDEPFHQTNELLQHADLAVDIAKQQGRNTWQWYKGKGTHVTSEHVLLRHDLHIALRKSQFELYYQPVVDAVSGHTRSVEALVRWHHPINGMMSPAVFIPIAEQTGQIIPLGRWVLRQACQTFAERYAKGERALPVAVNISSLQFRRDGFLDEVKRVLNETGLPPQLLELEMTESILLDGAEQATDIIKTLRNMGISVAIDDFGTGFSSLSYLRDLPINKIKLDRAFIHNILTSRPNAAIVQGIITMAHHMGLIVVAEGIETREQQQDLVRRKCDLIQGFLFSKPVPLNDLTALPEVLTANE